MLKQLFNSTNTHFRITPNDSAQSIVLKLFSNYGDYVKNRILGIYRGLKWRLMTIIIDRNNVFLLKIYLNLLPNAFKNYPIVDLACRKARTMEFLSLALGLLKSKNFSLQGVSFLHRHPLISMFLKNKNLIMSNDFQIIMPRLMLEFFNETRDYAHDDMADVLNEFNWSGTPELQQRAFLILPKNPIALYQANEPRELWPNLKYPSRNAYSAFVEVFRKTTLGDFTFELTKRNTKSFRKLIYKEVFCSDFENMYIINNLSYIMGDDDQSIIKAYYLLQQEKKTAEFVYEFRIYFDAFTVNGRFGSTFKFAYDIIGFTKFVKYFLKARTSDGEDTAEMIVRCHRHDIKIPYRDLKNQKALHDWMSIELTRLDAAPFALNQNSIQVIDGVIIDSIKLVVPKTNIELRDVGRELSICIGAGEYAEKALSRESDIILLFKDEKPYGAVEFIKGKLVQAKKAHNDELESNVTSQIEEIYRSKVG
jgi:hypothetical protein